MSNFTNSNLVSYTKLSPKCTKPRTQSIDTITIHTMAGNLSVETCGQLFQQVEASSNYGIGSDGRVGLYVEECNRSWCTSSRANDMRAVTIEVASINTTDYAPSDAAYATLIALVVDICKRNDIKKLVWSTDKNTRVNHLNGCNMTVHRDYSAKACPGDWLYKNMGKIAEEVNAKLTAPSVPSVVVPVESESEEAEMYNFLNSKGESVYFIFGLMANIWAESGIRANNLQNSYENKLKLSDEQYTAAVDNGSYTNFVRDSAGYGYAQWTYWSRKEALLNYAKSKGVSIGDPQMQREFLWLELTTTYKGMLPALRAAKSIREASDIVLTQFEKPADQSETVKVKRASYGQTLFEKYGNVGPDEDKETVSVPFLVRVLVGDLNIRKGPGTSYAIIDGNKKQITDYGVYTITEISMVGSTMWGKLKSGLGWICLTKYTQRV